MLLTQLLEALGEKEIIRSLAYEMQQLWEKVQEGDLEGSALAREFGKLSRDYHQAALALQARNKPVQGQS